jgi:phenylacetate-CoA ligase
VREAQIIQESLDCIRVLYVPAAGFNQSDASSIRSRLRERMGEVEVVLEPVASIERGVNGKLKPVVCRVRLP